MSPAFAASILDYKTPRGYLTENSFKRVREVTVFTSQEQLPQTVAQATARLGPYFSAALAAWTFSSLAHNFN
jgi:hypothetical protein